MSLGPNNLPRAHVFESLSQSLFDMMDDRAFYCCLTLMMVVIVTIGIGKTSASHLVKRSDDTNPYNAVVDAHSQELVKLQARLQVLENAAAQRTAFRVSLSSGTVPANAPIVFGSVELQLGTGTYDSHTGIYTVSTPGVYSIGYQLFPGMFTSFLIDLMVNGAIRIRSRCYDSTVYQTSCFASSLFHLQQGDKVWVQTTVAGTYFTGVHSFLHGNLLFADS